MKKFEAMRNFILLFSFVLLCFSYIQSYAQANVLNPNDPDVIFTASNQPAVPTYAKISKWGHTNRLSWNPYNYGYKSYYYKGMAFRVKFPKTYVHNLADGKQYPSMIFFHGLGEPGNIWDNEFHLVHGGEYHAQKINDGTFDGFMIYPQSQGGYLQSYFPLLKELVDSMVKYVKLDIDRIHIMGLSAGGQAVWDFPQNQQYAKITCALEPISAARYESVPYFSSYINIPIFVANGGQDISPYPSTVTDLINSYKNLGGNIQQAFFPDQGHGAWNAFWTDPRYWSFVNAQHKANPLVFFQHNKFCPGEIVNAKLGLQAGFYAYEWDKDGVTISGETTNQIIVTSFGTYRGRYKRTALDQWSVWSPTPAVISLNQATVSPAISINGLKSNVLPAPDGNTTTPLTVPNNYISYEWRRVADNVLVSSTNNYNAPVGQYMVKVAEQFGCGSDFSVPYTVIPANGSNKPDAASSLSAIAISNNAIQLNWNDNPSPLYNETTFEIYRSKVSGSGYILIGKNGTDVLSFLDQTLSANTRYYYLVRAVNNDAASPVTAEVNALTKSDITAPTAPANLKITGTTRSSVSLLWDASTDDVGVTKYEIFVNGLRSYVTTNTSFTVNNLTAFNTYGFYVKALDASGNLSPASNQVNGSAVFNGLNYKYYEGSWNALPDFNTLTPVLTGTTPNVSITQRLRNDQFGFLWEGNIIIPVTGTYKFETNSDDGSKLYIGNYNNASVALVNNDGLHGSTFKEGSITLSAGTYPIAITFFEQGGGESMSVYWTCVEAGIPTRTLIPNSAFGDNVVIASNLFPQKPDFLNALATDYNKINLSWIDQSNNESGFEISRSTSPTGTYINIGTTAADATSFIDSIGMAPQTIYWYKIRSVNQYGTSEFVSILEGKWGLNNNYNDESGNGRSFTANAAPVFNSADKKEGTHSISLNGTSQYLNLPFSTSAVFPANIYGTRSIGIWLRPNASMLAASTLNRVVYDFGGADNGIALRFNAGALQAAIASANNRFNIVVNNVVSNPNWIANGWNHVEVVYNVDNVKLYLNAVLVGSTNVNFITVGASANASRIGAANGTNAFNSSASASFYSGLLDDITIIKEPINANGITALMTQSYTADTTFVLPAIPAIPSNLVVTSKTSTSISLAFNDNSSNETLFELYRSASNLNNYRLLATIDGGSGAVKNYIDSNLFSNSNYYYKVRVIGIGGTSDFTANLLERTNNNPPVLAQIQNFTMRYGAQKNINLAATDVDLETMVLSFVNLLPSFATFVNTGNGIGTIQFNPTTTDQGVYTISALVEDGNGGTDTKVFTVTVDNNYTPVIAPVNNINLPESNVANINLNATDEDGNSSLIWTLTSTNSFVNLTDNGNGQAVIALTPGFANAGVYQITAMVSDGAGANEYATFTLTVTNQEPPVEKWFMSMKYVSANAAAPWNNISSTLTNNLLNASGTSTPVGIDFLNTNWNAGDAGAVTGNNSGVYPDAVIKDYFWFGAYSAPNTVNINLKGLTVGAKYNVTLFGSSAWTGLGNNGTTVYTINGLPKPLYVDKNNQNTVTFSAISPNALGNITVNLSKGAATPYGVVNAIVLEKPFDDGTAPLLPSNLTGQVLPNGVVKLDWNDIAYNESNYLVYRSTAPSGPFTLLNAAASNANDNTYTDITVLSTTTYYYKIEATNTAGSSGFTNTIAVTTTNKAPLLAAIEDVYAKATTSSSFNFAATDDVGDVLTTIVTGLPSFASYVSTGNGTGTISFNPSIDDLGTYSGIVVKVTDNSGASVSKPFNLTVTDNSVRSAYLNFGPDGATPQPAPWNNYLGYPFINNSYGGIKDDANTLTTFTFKFLTQWNGGLSIGMRTGNNKGVFPDNVMRTSFHNYNTGNHTIQFNGLNPTKKYSIGFLTNTNTGKSTPVTFTSGAQSVLIDGRYNTIVLANLNGLIPTALGSIDVVITKTAANSILCLNGVVIREYGATDPLVKPADLFAETQVQTDKIKLTWSDRSNDETGFEIWRAISANGTYTLVNTTAANTTSFTNTGLLSNTRYFYKVRAINGAIAGSYSNVASAILASKIVLINQNVDVAQKAPSPWNSTSSPSTPDATFSNLINTELINSGFEMVITKEFNGAGFAGVNANAVFPANVMVSNYWTDAGQTSQVKFQNLDLSKKYRIGCFGSNTNSDYCTANYSCNGKTVELNSFFNDIKVVYLDNLTPGGDGELILEVSTAGGSPYSFTGAYTIEYFDDLTNEPVINTINPQNTSNTLLRGGGNKNHVLPKPIETAVLLPVSEIKPVLQDDFTNDAIKVFPNPFTNNIQVQLNVDKNASVNILIFDIKGKQMFRSENLHALKGRNTISASLGSGRQLLSGTYIINILIDGKISKVEKLIKVN
jgi:large repetitive protein